jgi:nucleotide-binding universal stress UspA family protein
VVGVDGSPAADRALDWAIAEAVPSPATLDLVSAWLYPMAYGYAFTATVPAVQHRAQEIIDAAATRIRGAAPKVKLTTEAIEQAPGPALVAAAEDADLLVVGSRGLCGFEGLLLGVGEPVLRAPRRLRGRRRALTGPQASRRRGFSGGTIVTGTWACSASSKLVLPSNVPA